jgi:methylamine dehydrogenase heavy chain
MGIKVRPDAILTGIPAQWALALATLLGLTLNSTAVWAQLDPLSTKKSAEEHTWATLPEPSPHWVYVLDPVFPHIVAGKVYIVDGDKVDIIGMLNTGYTANLGLSPDKKEVYVAETFWSRGTRGDRIDVMTTFDSRTLDPGAEVKLPKGRYLVVPKAPDASVTPDGKYLLSYNMAPAMSVSVVDLKKKAYLGEVETPGCALTFPLGASKFAMICLDGGLATVTLDGAGKGKLERAKPFFDVVKDPVFEHAAWSRSTSKGFFVSYEGKVYPVDFAGGNARIGAAWSLNAEDPGWRPGGWQLTAYHSATKRLFVLMHEGGEWTHKAAGHEVWVFDTESKRRTGKVELEKHAISVAITQDREPLLYTLSELAALSVWDGTSFKHKGDIEPIGDSPYLLYVHGD